VTRLLELLVVGLSLGMLYALIAMGFVVIYRGTRVVNFAQGSLLLLGGYMVAILSGRIGFWAAAAAGVAVAMAGGALLRLLLAGARTHDHLVLALVTIGADILLTTELTRRIGPDVLALGDPWGAATVTLAGVTVPQARVAATVIAIALIAGFFALFTFTDWGVAMRAAAADPETAALMGIRLRRVSTTSWLIGGSLAAVAGVFLAAFPASGLDNHAGVVALNAIPAVILGGLDSTHGAVIGGLAVGLAETLAAGYGAELGFLGQGIGTVTPYAVMIAVLLWRPSGLFGTRELNRV
jgi:branched-chain amino acid transport system permease protein